MMLRGDVNMVASITRANITEEERQKIINQFKKIAANMIKDINSNQHVTYKEKTTI